VQKTLVKEDFHVTDYSPWEGWSVTGWPVSHAARKPIFDGGTLHAPPATAASSRARSTL